MTMKQITKAEFEKAQEYNYGGVWTTERFDLPNWREIRKDYIGKKTLLDNQDGKTVLLVEGLHFEIIENPPKYAYFNNFEFTLYQWQVDRVPDRGACDDAVEELSHDENIINQFKEIDPELIKDELREYGAWNDDELSDETENQLRVIWLAALDIKEAIATGEYQE